MMCTHFMIDKSWEHQVTEVTKGDISTKIADMYGHLLTLINTYWHLLTLTGVTRWQYIFTNASNDEFEEKGRHGNDDDGTEKPNE